MSRSNNMLEGESSMAFPEEITMVKMQPYPRRQIHFFYERPDGTIVDMSEQEAALGLKQKGKFLHFRQIGVSDGSAMIEYLKNCGYRPGQQVPYTKSQEIMREAYKAEVESARGNTRHPQLAEWAYPDGTVPPHERQRMQLPTNE